MPELVPVPANIGDLSIGWRPVSKMCHRRTPQLDRPGPPWQIVIPVTVGGVLFVRITSSQTDEHGELVIVHLNVALVPTGTPVHSGSRRMKVK